MSDDENLRDAITGNERMLENRLREATDAKDNAYNERNRLVAVLAELYPAHITIDTSQDTEWQSVICVHTPEGQATWHVHEAELPLFSRIAHKEVTDCAGWDGHTNIEKYNRLGRIRKVPKPAQGTATTLQLNRNCEPWPVVADQWHRGEHDGDWQRTDERGRAVATLRRIGWIDQKGRVWSRIAGHLGSFDGGSLTPLLIDPGERT